MKTRMYRWIPLFGLSALLHIAALVMVPTPSAPSAQDVHALLTPVLPDAKPAPVPEAPRDDKKEKQTQKVAGVIKHAVGAKASLNDPQGAMRPPQLDPTFVIESTQGQAATTL